MNIDDFNFTRQLIVLSLFIFFIKYKKGKPFNTFLCFLLIVTCFVEVIAVVLKPDKNLIRIVYTFYVMIIMFLWLFVLYVVSKRRKYILYFIGLFFLFWLCNLLFKQGLEEFNSYSFVFGSFLYLLAFVYENLQQLKNESISFFLANEYLLIFAPFLFFIGLSLIFIFDDISVAKVEFIGRTLYTLIGYYVNLIYYGLINIYIFKNAKH